MTILENMNLTGQFLIAMPAMTDPYFSKTVTYICTHNEDGAMGVIINQMNKAVHFGGPVQMERGFILHEPNREYDSTILVNNTVALTTSKDILEAAAQNNGPKKMLIALGYAGWTAGQLENEVSQIAWLSLDTSDTNQIHKLIFEADNMDKFDYAMRLMGLNLANLSEVAGHA